MDPSLQSIDLNFKALQKQEKCEGDPGFFNICVIQMKNKREK